MCAVRRSAETPRCKRPAQAMARRALRAPNTPSLRPSESKAPQERARRSTAGAHSTAQVDEGGRNRRITRTTRPTHVPAQARRADIELTRRAQRAPSSPMITTRPRRPARLTALSLNQLSARSYSAPYHLGESIWTAVNLGWELGTAEAKYSTKSDRHCKDTRSQPHTLKLIIQ